MNSPEQIDRQTVLLADSIVNNTFYIKALDKKLIIIYDGKYKNLGWICKSDEEIESYIKENLDEAYYQAIERINDLNFVLNIPSQESLGNIKTKNGGIGDTAIINRMLRIYMPIIQRFMAEAISNNLNISKFRIARLFGY